MRCQNCNSEMINNLIITRDYKISYDICEKCGGVWLDRGELDTLFKHVEGSLEYSSTEEIESAEEKERECPRCKGKILDKVYFLSCSDLILDRCGNCHGYWLDGGELEKIQSEIAEMLTPAGKSFLRLFKSAFLPYWTQRIKRKSSQTDFNIHIPPIKGAEKISDTRIPCPVCGNDKFMDLYRLIDVEFESCPSCRGIYLDADELQELKEKQGNRYLYKLHWLEENEGIERSMASPSNRFCPKCESSRMMAANYGQSDILIDWCPECRGIWLDNQEFDGVIRYLKKKLKEMTSAEMKSRLMEEISHIWRSEDLTWDEVLETKAALSALAGIAVFEHPSLFRFLNQAVRTARSAGLI